MDNITHTLIGITLGRSVSRPQSDFRDAAIWTAILGNNFPDIDILFKPFITSGSLGYLLHHRGYTHTVVSALLLGAIAAYLGAKIARLKNPPYKRLLILGWLSVLLHLAADYCNNYGIHPLYPFWNQWIYGDFLFILEPLLWLAILPLAHFTARTKLGKLTSLLLELGLLSLVAFGKYTPLSITIGIFIWAVAFIFVYKKTTSTIPAYVAIGIVLLSFKSGSYAARSELESIVQKNNPEWKIHQLSLSPSPANPTCWSVAMAATDQSQTYISKAGVFSLFPDLFGPENCYIRNQYFENDLFSKSTTRVGSKLIWNAEFHKPVPEFLKLAQEDCRFKNFLKYSRIPIWSLNTNPVIASDLRYERGAGSFVRVSLGAQQECPEFTPPWTPPLQDLFP